MKESNSNEIYYIPKNIFLQKFITAVEIKSVVSLGALFSK